MRPVTVRVGPLAAAAVGALAAAQAGSAGVALALNGPLGGTSAPYPSGGRMVTSPVATPDMPRRVGLTSSGNDSGITFTIAGTNWSGQPVSEVLAGAVAGQQVQSVLDYATVTSIVPSGATAGTVSADTTSVASSPWVRLDHEVAGSVGIQCAVTGTVVATLEQSLNNPNAPSNPTAPAAMRWLPTQDGNGQGFTADLQSNYAEAPTFARVTITAGTGSVAATYVQQGGPGPT